MGNIVGCTIGIDIGKTVDPSAIAVFLSEARDRDENDPSMGWDMHYLERFIKRLPLGMKYPDQIDRFEQVIATTIEKFWQEYHFPTNFLEVFIDVTGVGEGIVDLLEPRTEKLGIWHLNRVRFTYGDRVTRTGNSCVIGKGWLGNRLQLLSESRRIHLDANNPDAVALSQEMMDFDIDVDENGGERYGAIRPGTHDDQVIALALATIRDEPASSITTLDGRYYNKR
jgi:hypothetical protein